MPATTVQYALDDGTVVSFEVEPGAGFRPAAGPDEVVGAIRNAVAPAVEGAKILLERVKETQPDGVELKFGVKASGTMNWWVAKAASEGNFEITLTWKPGASAGG